MTINAWTGLQDPAAPANIREGEPYNNPQFEELARTYGIWGTAQAALCAQFWQAARRAPAVAVPQGWKLGQPITEEMHIAAVKVLHRASGVAGLPQRMLDAALAAAPQSHKAETDSLGMPLSCGKPDCGPHKHHPLCDLADQIHDTGRMVAAPAQMPEPDGYIMDSLPDGRLEYKRGPLDHMDSLCCSTMPVYEHGTVRQLFTQRAA